ncbi:Sec-independent protein translocase protein TatB [uncultured Thiohalocapsa sp.]|uniref:Sec-independent protein translocase protein TatB n=1 Tax=uncultured Thiohalocapsa sp. TaxID=768990 RepID=UPI0025F37D22|nr:Sec-independent protein translocase protein TatB [uncultured Thiohalocapsa sp.]
MFDIGALELILIGVVALLVVGPERLPKLARTAGLWAGRARRAFMSVKDEIDREIKAEELKEVLRKQSASNPLEQIIEVDGSIDDDSSPPKQATAPKSGQAGHQAEARSIDGVAPEHRGDPPESTRP